MISFFIQHYEWSDWKQFSPRWLEDYIDARLRGGIASGTINWDLIYFRAFCQFLIDEGFEVPSSILKLKVLDTPRRLPRPLSAEQVRRLERCIQTAITEAKTDRQLALAVRDLACFYLLWHCGLRISEVSYLQLNDFDLDERKLFIRNSKERKDRVAYMSDTAAMALQQHLAILGVIVGVINVTAEDTRGFLLAAIGLSVSATALNASPIVGTAFSYVLPFVVAFVAGATIVVSLRELFQTARS